MQGSEIPGEVNIENGTDQGTYGNFDSTGAKQPQKKGIDPNLGFSHFYV